MSYGLARFKKQPVNKTTQAGTRRVQCARTGTLLSHLIFASTTQISASCVENPQPNDVTKRSSQTYKRKIFISCLLSTLNASENRPRNPCPVEKICVSFALMTKSRATKNFGHTFSF